MSSETPCAVDVDEGVQRVASSPPSSVHPQIIVCGVLVHPASVVAGKDDGFAIGAIESTRTTYEATPTFPALSVHVDVRVWTPCPEDSVEVVQFVKSTPDVASAQFQVTLTGERLHPLEFTDVDTVGVAIGAVVSTLTS